MFSLIMVNYYTMSFLSLYTFLTLRGKQGWYLKHVLQLRPFKSYKAGL